MQKRKRKAEQVENYLESKKLLEADDCNTIKKSPKLKSIAIAIAGSIVDNVQTEELATYLAGQIARAAAIYKIDEVSQICEFLNWSRSNCPPQEGEIAT